MLELIFIEVRIIMVQTFYELHLVILFMCVSSPPPPRNLPHTFQRHLCWASLCLIGLCCILWAEQSTSSNFILTPIFILSFFSLLVKASSKLIVGIFQKDIYMVVNTFMFLLGNKFRPQQCQLNFHSLER